MRKLSVACLAVAIALGAQRTWAAPTTGPTTSPTTEPIVHQPAQPGDFLRFVDRGEAGSRLETADIAYRNADGVTVHLVAAVHIAEREYFENLNASFKQRDAVLYEMVKSKDRPPPGPGENSDSGVSQVQRFIKNMLNLEFQLDVIDYTQPNFVHADLDAETFEKMQAERGESFTSLIMKSMFKQMSATQPATGATDGATTAPVDPNEQMEDLVRVFTRPDSERQLKLMLAKNLVQMEGSMGVDMLGGTVILTERNKACIATLQKTLKEGKKDIVIFFGAAHMPELSAKLSEMGFTPVSVEWRMAWDLAIRSNQPSAVESLFINMIRDLKEVGQ